MRTLAAALWIVTGVIPTVAQTVVCFGNEPNWAISVSSPDRASVILPGSFTPHEFRGRETRNDFIHESVWRGSPTSGGQDIVLFRREAPCSDGMSDKTHPMFASASLPDGSFVTGCCRIESTGSTTTLEGLPWRLVSLPGQSPSTLAALQRPVSVQFDSGRVSGFTGCNTMSGSYTVNGNQLKLGTVAGTMMACPGPASTVESAFNKAFAGTLSYVITSDRLNLTTASHYVLSFEREAAATLTGRTWNVTGYNNGRQGVVSPIAGSPITLTFAEGRVSGRAGCNTFNGSYTQTGNSIKIGTLATTRMMCAQDVMAQEREFLKALESAVKWDVQGDRLDMHRADGQRALEATPNAAATLTGRSWSVTGFNNGRQGVVSPIISSPITLSFADGRVSGRTGCNTFNGSFTQQGNTIKFGTMAVTNMMCALDVMAQEREFLRALESAVRWDVQGDRLDMHRADGERALEATPEVAATLSGAWSVTGFNNGRQGVVSPIISSPITLTFADGRVSGQTGCNTFNGSFTQQSNTIKMGPMAVTNMMCAQDVMAQEREFLRALESAVKWDVQGNRLDMHRADGQRALEATPAAAATLSGAWSVTGFNNGRQGVVSPIVNSPITLSFAEGRVSGRTGCNTFNGSFTQTGNSIKMGPMAVTNMMCAQDVMAQEREFLKALESAVRWDVQGNRLDMHRADGERALEATPDTAATLTGRAWTITGINNGRDAVASPITGTRLMLSFGGGGRVTGNAGCNTYSGSFNQQGDTVRIGSITTTGRRCPENVMTQERDFLRALRSVARWNIQGDQLEMHRTDGQTALTASSGPVN